MLTEDEIIELEKLSNPIVNKLLNYWKENQEDGFAAARIAINKKWLSLASDLDDTDIQIKGDDRVYESFLKTTKLFEDITKATSKLEQNKLGFKSKKGGSKHEGKALM